VQTFCCKKVFRAYAEGIRLALHFLTTARQVLGGSQRFHIAHLPNFLSNRAFIIADSNKRRALSRADIAKVLAKSDFLVDFVPREEGLTGLTQGGAGLVPLREDLGRV